MTFQLTLAYVHVFYLAVTITLIQLFSLQFDSITSSEALDALLRVEPKDQVLPAISRIIHKCLIES